MKASESIGRFRRRADCRGCKSPAPRVFLDYGDMPLAGDFRPEPEAANAERYPMDLAVCLNCGLVQIPNVVSPRVLFTDYRYLSSVTQTLSQHFRDYAALLAGDVLANAARPFVVEFGCNDGVLLEPLGRLGIEALGVDAAANVVEVARRRGLEVWQGFFDRAMARRIASERRRADVITASNVFAHIDDLDEVMLGVDELLAKDGSFIVEVHYLPDLLKDFQFDTVYHEHLCYYSLHALQALCARFGFGVAGVQRIPIHGGSVRVFIRRNGTPDDAVTRLLEAERAAGIDRLDTYLRFSREVEEHRARLRAALLEGRSQGRSLSAFGAAGRATILLNYCGLDRGVVDYVVDESAFRVGRCVPGVRIPIVSRDYFHAHPTDDCLITAWNYRDEVVGKERAYLAAGGRFIVPLPRIEYIADGGR